MRRLGTLSVVAAIASAGFGILLLAGIPQVPSGTWAPAGFLADARMDSETALLDDGRVLIIGGTGLTGALATVELFDTDGSWWLAAPMAVARTGHTATALADGRVLVTGGQNADGVTADAELYYPASNVWVAAGGMVEARAGHTATLLDDGRVVIAGGSSEPSFSVEIFDPATDSFTYAGSSPLVRTDHAAALLGDGRVLLAGGWSAGAAIGAADIYDPATGLLTPTTDLQVARTGHSATALIGGQVLIVGGRDGVTDLSSVELFDPVTETFAVVGSALAVGRSGHRAFRLPNNNNVLVAGGRAAGVPLASAELFTPWTGAVSATSAMGAARAGLRGSAVGQDGLLLVAGGATSESLHVSSELYGFATVKTDKDDYVPGQTVVITGGGWQPGETVTLLLQEDVSPPFHDDLVLTATADENGNILNTEFFPLLHDVGVTFYLTATGAGSQAQITFRDSNPAVSHEQCQPGSLYPGGDCINNGNPDGWKSGQNSGPWNQGDSVPYRALFIGMVNGDTYTLRIEYDTTKALEHAIDYPTTFNRTISTADACSDEASAAVCADVDTEPIPADPQVTAGADGIQGTPDDITQEPGDFTLYGGTITAVTYTEGDVTGAGIHGDPFVYQSDGRREISVEFRADSDGEMVLTWGGHIALNSDWGMASPQGSPYHMRFNEFTCSTNNCSTGQQDRALSQGAVIPENADLSITKDDDLDPVVAGTTLTYTVTVTNSALSANDAINVVVTDTLPAGVTFVSTTGCTEDPNGVPTCSLGDLAIGASTSFDVTVTVDPSTTGTITNTATVTSDTPDDDLTNNTATEDTEVVSNPSILLEKIGTFTDDNDDLVVDLTDGDGLAQPGELISYDFTVTNDGDVTLTFVTLTDTIGGVTITALTDVAGNGVSVLEPGDVETATGTYAITQVDIDAGSKDNTATATGTPPVGDDVTATDDATVTLPQNVTPTSLTLEKTLDSNADEDGSGDVSLDDTLTYQFVATNESNVTLTGVTIVDPLPGLSALSCTPTQPGTLAPDAAMTCTATYTVTQADVDAGVINNTATADSNETDPVDDSHSEPIVRVSTIDLDKTGVLDLTVVGPADVANPGDIINYTFTVENTGNTTLDTVALSDTIGGVTITALTDVASNGVDVLAPGDIETATGTYAIDQADIDAGVKDNTADVDAVDPSDTPVNDDDSHSEPIVRVSTIDLDKTGVLDLTVVGPAGVANPGDIINYTFTVENTGNTTLDTVALSDTIGGVTITALTDVASNGVDVLAPGDIETATGTYAIDQADIDAGVKDNTADVDAVDPSDTPVNDDDSHSEPIVRVSTIDLDKTGVLDLTVVGPAGVANPGDIINYSFTVTNDGNVTVSNITVTDPLVTVLGGPISLAPGGVDSTAFTGSYVVTQADVDAGSRANLALATGQDPGGADVTDDDDHTEPLPQNPSIVLAKTGTFQDENLDGFAQVGETISYSFTVTNDGNVTVSNITVTDPLVTVLGGPISLAPGGVDSTAFTGSYVVTQADVDAGSRANLALATGQDPGGADVTDDDDHTEPLPQNPGMSIEKTPDLQSVMLGGTASFTITVENTGNVTLTSVVLTDPLATSLGALSDIAGNGVDVLAPGDVETASASVSPVTGDFFNVAIVDGSGPQGQPVSYYDDAFVDALPVIAVTKTASPANLAWPGGEVTFTILVTNNSGAGDTLDVSISDDIYGDLSVTDDEGGTAKPQLTALVCDVDLGTLPPGATATCTFTADFTLPEGDFFGDETDEVTVTGTDEEGNTANNSDDATVTIAPPIAVTDSSLCFFDVDGDPLNGRQFRRIFTQDVTNMPLFKLTATNPGQFFGVYPGFPMPFWGLSGFFVGELTGKALWKLVENAQRFPRRGGRVLRPRRRQLPQGPVRVRQDGSQGGGHA